MSNAERAVVQPHDVQSNQPNSQDASLKLLADSQPQGGSHGHHTPGTWESLANGSWADFFRGIADYARAGGDVVLAPVDLVYDTLKGNFESELTGLKDLSHGDIVGGVGHLVGAPIIGAVDGIEGGGRELINAGKNIWHGVENEFNSVTHSFRAIADYGRAAGDIVLTPIAGVFDDVKGTVGSEVKGLKDLAHGDVISGVGHIVGAPVIGAVDGVKGAAHEVAHAAKNIWHGIENAF